MNEWLTSTFTIIIINVFIHNVAPLHGTPVEYLPFASERVPSDNLLLWGIMSLPVYPLPLRSDKAVLFYIYAGISDQPLYARWLVA